ncbi:MAG: carbamoyltransferase HypF [Nitrososphaeraceae archaeon]
MRIIISGTIQGVGFRPFIYRIANESHLYGYIQNKGDGIVEICIQGSQKNIELFLRKIKNEKPILAHYDDIGIKDIEENKKYNDFTIIDSSNTRSRTGSSIHPDISICKKCTMDFLQNKGRYQYPFISCTECGPKFTTLRNFPYDRTNTTMSDFPMCKECESEYNDPNNRLFHYELISCTECGPKFSIVDNKGHIINTNDPISLSAKLLMEGNIIAAKGLGGFHIITSSINSDPILKLRNKKDRKNKPFAIMGKDVESIKSFACVNDLEEKTLTSMTKPIVLLHKSNNYFLSPFISPNLHNIGVMLPYMGLHIILFKLIEEPALVMTSGNESGNPIIKDDKEAIKSLGNYVDYLLVHNREIFSRCDDSITKIIEDTPILLRRSRGFVPSKISFTKSIPDCILALGGEKNVTFSILSNEDCFISQHIGDLYNPDSYLFFKSTIKQMMKFLNLKPSFFACDLHPSMLTTNLAYNLAQNESNVFQVQHHHSHIASLMAEHNIQDIIGVVCDGIGYGLDGNLWGGEIFKCENVTNIQRIGHLIEQPMIGGDLATLNPLRMAAGILFGKVDGFEDFLYSNLIRFQYGHKEIESIISNLQSDSYPKTTSTGRILDAISSLLGICYKRTYEGEPAISLESSSINGKDIFIDPKISGNILDTSYLLKCIYENRDRVPPNELGYSAHAYLAKGLAEIAAENALSTGIKVVGFSGGVAHNKIFTKILKEEIEKRGIRFLLQQKLPPGDGGISVGQAYYTMNKILNC